MPAACLADTGLEQLPFAIMAVVAVVLLAVGVIAMRTARGRVALAVIPLAMVGLAVTAPAQPAQAIAAAVPGFSVDGDWDWESMPASAWFYDEPLTAEQEATLDTLDGLIEAGATTTTVVLLESNVAPFQSGTIDPSSVTFDGYVPHVDSSTVGALIDLWGTDIDMTVTITVDYMDDCGKPLQTVVQWTGEMLFSL